MLALLAPAGDRGRYADHKDWGLQMTPEIRQDLEAQLMALRDLVEARFQHGGNIHWKLGDTLNVIRARIISENSEADRHYLESTIPAVEVNRPQKGEGEYTVSSHEGFRLFRQLLPLVSGLPRANSTSPDDEVKSLESDIAPNIFIGHGRSRLWARIQVFLEHELGLRTASYESESRIGESIVPILQHLLDQAAFAVLLLTSEDETAQGTKRARQNVIHEIGLFQGRLGFRRVVLLKQEGIEEFSNVAGLQYIAFEGDNIEGAFHELQRVLQREGLVVR